MYLINDIMIAVFYQARFNLLHKLKHKQLNKLNVWLNTIIIIHYICTSFNSTVFSICVYMRICVCVYKSFTHICLHENLVKFYM